MKAYRVTFSKQIDVDYWNKGPLQAEAKKNFNQLPDIYYPIIKEILDFAQRVEGIEHIWFFYEPEVEITWLCDYTKSSQRLIQYIKLLFKEHKIKDLKVFYPKKNSFGPDWFCNNPKEMEFGAKRHALCCQFVQLYNEYKDSVDTGKGLKQQVGRTIHTLCNPLGLNYADEAAICFSRGLACVLFRYFSFKTAKFIFTKILRQKY